MWLKLWLYTIGIGFLWILNGYIWSPKYPLLRLITTLVMGGVLYDKTMKPKQDRRRRLSGASATMAQGGMPKSTNIPDAIINSLIYVTTEPDVAAAKKFLQERLVRYERFSSIAIPGAYLGEYVWQPVAVHVDDHIIEHTVADDQSLYDLAMKITETKLRNPLLPRWEVHIIRNTAALSTDPSSPAMKSAKASVGSEAHRYDAVPPTGKSNPSQHMILFRLCHSIGDGIGLVTVFQDLLQDTQGRFLNEVNAANASTSTPSSPVPRTDLASPTPSPAAADAKSAASSSDASSARIQSVSEKNTLKGRSLSWAMVKDVLNSTLSFLTMAAGVFDTGLAFNGCASQTGQTYSGRRRMIKVRPFSLAMVKDIKNRANVTVNDVCYAATAAAIRHYSIAKANALPKATSFSIQGKTTPFEQRKANVDITGQDLMVDDDGVKVTAKAPLVSRSMMPMAFPRSMTKPEAALKNHFTFVSVDMATFESSAKQRLLKTNEITSKLKRSPQALVSMKLSELVTAIAPLAFVQQTVADTFSRHSLVFSNVPGPDQPIYFLGARVNEVQMVYPNLITQVGLLSYNGSMFMNFTLDDQAIPNPELLGVFFHDELRRYCKLYGVEYRDAPYFDFALDQKAQ